MTEGAAALSGDPGNGAQGAQGAEGLPSSPSTNQAGQSVSPAEGVVPVADKPWYEHIEIYKPSLEMRLTEHDGTIHIITYDDIIDGLLKMKEYYASNTNYDPYQEICDETGDANTASCFMEFIIFGEPTYC